MNEHLSRSDQNECVLGQRTSAMVEHLQDCAMCRAEITKLKNGISLFRDTANQWSAQSLAERPVARFLPLVAKKSKFKSIGWSMAQLAVAAMVLLMLFVFHPWVRSLPSQKAAVQPAAAISDDALLQQVDDQLSVAVPTSMESLTHLVTADTSQTSQSATAGSRQHVQTN